MDEKALDALLKGALDSFITVDPENAQQSRAEEEAHTLTSSSPATPQRPEVSSFTSSRGPLENVESEGDGETPHMQGETKEGEDQDWGDIPEEYRAAMESLLAQMSMTPADEDAPAGAEGGGGDAVQDSLNETLEMIAKAAKDFENVESMQAEGMTDEEMVAKLMENMSKLEHDPNFRGMMDSMVSQLLSKDVLYPGLKDLQGKFPAWLRDNGNMIPPEDRARYEEQVKCLQVLIEAYEEKNPNMERIMVLFEEMHQHGPPPDELVKSVAPGVEIGEDGIPLFPGAPGGPPASSATGDGPGCCVM